jgi:probable HAF family extracellular repeat protein
VAITSPLFGNYALSYGINESGEIIGFTIQNAFIYTTASGASYIPSAVDAVSVNDNGQVTGGLANGDAYLYTPGIGVTDLGTVGGKSAYGVAINSNGDIVGNVQNLSNNQVAFLYNGGVTDLGTLGGGQSYAEGINESDEVVGQAWTTGDASADAFLYTNGTMYDLNSLTGGLPNGTTLQNAYGINNTGWIIANGNDDATYLLEPDIAVPEPRSLALVNSGVAIFVVLLFVADRVRSMRSWLPRFAVVFPLRDFVGVGVWFYVATLILRGKLFNPINNQHFDRRSLWNEF